MGVEEDPPMRGAGQPSVPDLLGIRTCAEDLPVPPWGKPRCHQLRSGPAFGSRVAQKPQRCQFLGPRLARRGKPFVPQGHREALPLAKGRELIQRKSLPPTGHCQGRQAKEEKASDHGVKDTEVR